jgi:hypothetical protein
VALADYKYVSVDSSGRMVMRFYSGDMVTYTDTLDGTTELVYRRSQVLASKVYQINPSKLADKDIAMSQQLGAFLATGPKLTTTTIIPEQVIAHNAPSIPITEVTTQK